MFDDALAKMLQGVFGGDFIQTTYNSLMVYNSSFSKTVESILNSVEDVTKPIAGVLVCLYFIMSLVEKVTADNFTTDQFIKLMLKLALSIIVIENISDWAIIIMNFGITFTNSILASIQGSLKEIATFDTSAIVKDAGPGESIGYMALLLIPYAGSFLIKIGIYFLTFGRAIEIGVRAIFAPIGCADLINGGANSNGFRYVKKMLVVSMQGAIMLVIVAVSSTLVGNIFAGATDKIDVFDLAFIGKYFGTMMSMVGMMAASKQIASDILGA